MERLREGRDSQKVGEIANARVPRASVVPVLAKAPVRSGTG